MRLYPALLGTRFEVLPEAIRDAHRQATAMRGTVTIERGDSMTSRIAALLAGFPKACSNAPCEVVFIETGKGERCVRDMNGSIYSSTLMPASEPGCLDESFGAYGFRFRLHANDEGVHFEMIRHTLFGVRVPRAFWPRIITRERDFGGRYAFFRRGTHIHRRVACALRGHTLACRGRHESLSYIRPAPVGPCLCRKLRNARRPDRRRRRLL